MIDHEMTYLNGARVLVWRLEEDAPQLLSLCCESGIPVEDMAGLPVKRQREKAAEMLLLCHALGRPVKLGHDKQGAPAVEGEKVNISITHTPHLVALAVDDKQVIGVDAEQKERHQVLRVRDKFLNTNEQQFINPNDLEAHVIAWTAKESIIKAERNGAIDWTEGIRLNPFVFHPVETSLTANCTSGRSYRLISRLHADHFITLATLEIQ